MIEFAICALALLLVGNHFNTILKRQKANHGLPSLENVMRGDANDAQRRDMADALAKSVIDRAKSLKKPPLFVTASGDVYDDFFPPRQRHPSHTAEQHANAVLADCVMRYREARNSRNVGIVEFQNYALCAGAGLAVSAFRNLAGDSPDMHDLAEFLAPAPSPDDWESYREYYREAGELLDVPQARIDAALAKRRERLLH